MSEDKDYPTWFEEPSSPRIPDQNRPEAYSQTDPDPDSSDSSETADEDSVESLPSPANELEEIKQLLFGQEREQITGLETRIKDPGLHARDVSEILPQAVRLATARDEKLALSLGPAVADALKQSIRQNPAEVADAIFPVLGPGIRKAIAETFNRLIQSLNQALEHSFSLKGLSWRVEAWRSGKSFAEIVLYHTLVYRVEQVFLIHKNTGLLLCHSLIESATTKDGDMVSGMLKAIQDFVHDSFQTQPDDTLHNMQVGDVTVWIESGPQAVLAFVIRGHPDAGLREIQQNTLEQIHLENGQALEEFQGDTVEFESAQPVLDSCLLAQFGQQTRKSPLKLILLALIVIALAGWWIYQRWDTHTQRQAVLQQLDQQPGIVVVSESKDNGQWIIQGLKDPLAPDPMPVLRQTGLKMDNTIFKWHPFQSLDPDLILPRARSVLLPPPNVSLFYLDGILYAEGPASAAWIQTATQNATTLPGIDRFDGTGLVDADKTRMDILLGQVSQRVIFFDHLTVVVPGEESTLESLAAELSELHQIVGARDGHLGITLRGHSDATGNEPFNLKISQERANYVRGFLMSRGLPGELFQTEGLGSTAPRQAKPEDKFPNHQRRTTVHLTLRLP